MSLVKRIYVDGETRITAQNLNAIQDAIIALEGVVPSDASAENKLATEQYVEEYGGAIDEIQVQGTPQTIVDKTVNLQVPTEEDFQQYQQEVAVTDARHDSEIQFIVEANEGVTVHVDRSSSVNYEKPIPAYQSGTAKLADIKAIGGKTVVTNQFVKNGNFVSSSYWGAEKGSFSVANNEGSYTVTEVSSTAYGNRLNVNSGDTLLFNGHKFYATFETYSEKSGISVGLSKVAGAEGTFATTVANQWVKASAVVTITESGRLWLRILNPSVLAVGDVVKFRNVALVDLTKWFNSGNEPTALTDAKMHEVYAYLAEHPEYNEGTLQSADLKRIDSTKADDTLIDSRTIPQALRTFLADKGYGWSAGSVYNELDLVNKKFIKRVDSVDMGDLAYSYIGEDTDYPHFISSSIYRAYYAGASALACAVYEIYPRQTTTSTIYADMVGKDMKIYAQTTSRNIRVLNRSYTTAAELKSAMSGVLLYYELEEPVEYDISSYLASFNPLMNIENGGSLTFVQEDTELQVPNTEDIYYILGGAS